MKAKNILMTLLLVTGAIAAKASGFPPELALVSQPVMVYNYNSVTVYYDVENIGDYTYRGNVCIYLDPDDGFSYAEKYVKVRPGRIKRIAVEIPSYSIDRHFTYTIMPYYTIGRELYSFTTFEYFEPIRFCWHGTRTEPWVVIHIGYPATHNWSSEEPKPNSSNSSATVRPNNSGSSTGSATSGSMSSGNANTGNNSGSVSNGNKPNAPAAPRNDSGSVSRPSNSRPSAGTSNSGRTGNSGSSRVNNNSNSSRPSSGTSTSGRTGNSNVNRSSSSTNRSGNSSNSGSSRASSSSSSSRSSGTSTSSTTRSSSSSSRSSSGTSSRSGSANSGRR